jgi:Tripartite tricarboxylate transporter TctB family
MILRRDHVGAAILIALGIAVLAFGTDLPVGTASSPGPGMMPYLCGGLLIALAAWLLVRAHTGPAFSTVEWTELPHALTVLAFAGGATLAYTTLGFPLTFGLMLFGLMFGIERMPLVTSFAVSVLMAGGTYLLLGALLKTPMPRGIFGF